jgi:hypothetical protein
MRQITADAMFRMVLCAGAVVFLCSPLSNAGWGHPWATTPPGTGSEADPYLISELGHLVWMGRHADESAGKFYRMTADIDAAETATWDDGGGLEILEGFPPIGTFDYQRKTFQGRFDGAGHIISGLYINRPDQSYGLFYEPWDTGLFGYVEGDAVIQNVGLVDCNVTGETYVGALVGSFNSGTVSNCYATGKVYGQTWVGGLLGINRGEVRFSHSSCDVTAWLDQAGGLAGVNVGKLTACCATGPVHAYIVAGGLVGSASSDPDAPPGEIVNCFASGPVAGDRKVGSLVGRQYLDNVVTNAFGVGPVTGQTDVGGLIGLDELGRSTVTDCYWDTESTGQSTSAGGTGKTTAELQQQATFANWDFVTTWGIDAATSYPYLQIAPPDFALDLQVHGPGSVSLSPPPAPDGTYPAGTLVTLSASHDPSDSILKNWAGATPTGPLSATVLMDTHRAVHVTFVPSIPIATLDDLAKIGNDPNYPLANVSYTLVADINASVTATWNVGGADAGVRGGSSPSARSMRLPSAASSTATATRSAAS